MNYNYKNYKNIEYVTQEEIDKMSYNEKFFPPCKCGKKGEFRWIKCEKTYHEGYDEGKKGMFYSITPCKGRNGEEVCHKCAPCVKCGSEGVYGRGFEKWEKTNDNPSGKWALVYCSKECYDGKEKPSLPKKEPEKTASCDYCGKLSEIRVGNAFWGKSFCSNNCYGRHFAHEPLKNRDEISAHCCICSFRIFQDGWFTENFKNQNRKVHFSDSNINAFYCSETCFEKRGDISGMSGSAFHDRNPIQSDNSPKPNPSSPVVSQPITNSNDKSDNSVSPGNSPQPNPGKDKSSETKDNDRIIKLVENKENKSNTNDSEVLVIDLKNIKRITLRDDKLEIEFNSPENSNYTLFQTITAEQVNSNQELQTIKNYCQKNGKSSLSQSELNGIFNANKTDTQTPTNKPTDNDNKLAIGLSITVALIVGLAIGLLLKRRKKVKKS